MTHKIGTEEFNAINLDTGITRLACCGMAEFASLGNYTTWLGTEGVVYKIADCFARRFINGCFIVFSQVMGHGAYGDQLADFVLTNGLGRIIKSNKNVNPNSTNTIMAYIWEVDRNALRDWYVQRGISPMVKALATDGGSTDLYTRATANVCNPQPPTVDVPDVVIKG